MKLSVRRDKTENQKFNLGQGGRMKSSVRKDEAVDQNSI